MEVIKLKLDRESERRLNHLKVDEQCEQYRQGYTDAVKDCKFYFYYNVIKAILITSCVFLILTIIF